MAGRLSIEASVTSTLQLAILAKCSAPLSNLAESVVKERAIQGYGGRWRGFREMVLEQSQLLDQGTTVTKVFSYLTSCLLCIMSFLSCHCWLGPFAVTLVFLSVTVHFTTLLGSITIMKPSIALLGKFLDSSVTHSGSRDERISNITTQISLMVDLKALQENSLEASFGNWKKALERCVLNSSLMSAKRLMVWQWGTIDWQHFALILKCNLDTPSSWLHSWKTDWYTLVSGMDDMKRLYTRM